MSSSASLSILVIAAAAVVAPLLSELFRRWRVPSVLFELLLGIVVGPSVLGWVELGSVVQALSNFGLALLFFMAGYELDFAKLRGAPLNRAMSGWAVSLVLGLGVGAVLALEGFVISSLLIGLALTTTAIGTLLPIMRDRGLLGTRYGSYLTAAGAVGEFGPIIAITILLSASQPATEALLLVLFGLLAVAVAAMATRTQPPKLIELLQRHLSTSTQLPVRIILLLVAAMVAVAVELGLDNLLGAFAAGLIARLALSPEQNAALTPRLEAIGFGFLIPIFFIVSGVAFDLDTLLSSPSTVARLFIFLGLMLVVRGLPALLVYRGVLAARERVSLMFVQCAALPLIVVITQIGQETHDMTTENATALLGAGMASVLVFPLLGFALLGRSDAEPEEPVRPGESESLGGLVD